MIDQNTENVNLIDENPLENSQLEETILTNDDNINNEVIELEEISEVTEEIFEIKEITEVTEEIIEIPKTEEIQDVIEEIPGKIEEIFEIKEKVEEISEINIEELTNGEILNRLSFLINETNVEESKKNIETLFDQYSRNQKNELKKTLQELKETHGEDAKIDMPKDVNEEYLKELSADYKKKKYDLSKEQEIVKQRNLEIKLEIIEKIKTLANGDESLNESFKEFRNLQKQWLETGLVPNRDAENLNKNYKLQIDRFNELLKINDELRKLDQKRNLTQKIELCEKAEELLIEPDVTLAYNKFQQLFASWKEIGGVPADKREEIWDRFREVGGKLRQNFNQNFEKLREERNNNYNLKVSLCEKIETLINDADITSGKKWNEISDQIVEFQKEWKLIGMVPYHLNSEIYNRFKSICNKFFDTRNEFFNKTNAEYTANIQKKTELCIIAESLQNNTNWNETSKTYRELRIKWKEIGRVPKKYADELWTRFDTACNSFYATKAEAHSNLSREYSENKEKKEALIQEILNFVSLEDQTKNLEKLKSFKNQWFEIGDVEYTESKKLYTEYKKAIDSLYEKLNLTSLNIERNDNKRRNDIGNKQKTGKINYKAEREKILQNIRSLELEINKIEITMSYFTKGSGGIKKEFEDKIQKIRDEISILKEKKKSIDLEEREAMQKQKDEEQIS
ncbi:MAG: DUF349 domain-containing protein [Bacteroidales bacterium]|jgi:hypothetical protein|nr:DUF349 domain-containing protein [Bacteroidales bacterium]